MPRSVVVIGCSAGGVEALPKLLHAMPDELPASITIVQHMAASETPYLVDILRRSSALPIAWAEQGTRLVPGHVYVGPPGVHTLIANGHLSLVRGPRENHARPSINKLFRSAAAHHHNEVVAVLLTGMLDDGVAGLRAVRDSGGAVIVQDPEDAAFPDLPANALLVLRADRVLPLLGIPSALVGLCGGHAPATSTPEAVMLEAELDRIGQVTPSTLSRLGDQTQLACAECKGPTWVLGHEGSRYFRCYQGHVSSARDLLVHQTAELEAALWSAVRALSERAATLELLAADSTRVERMGIAEAYAERAAEARKQAELARTFVLDIIAPD